MKLCVLLLGLIAIWSASIHAVAASDKETSVKGLASQQTRQQVLDRVGATVAHNVHARQETAAARLLGLVLDTYIPKTLYEEKGIAWMGGKRTLTITKAGAAVLDSTASVITVNFPLRAELRGNVNTNLVLVQIKASCEASFTAPAAINLTIDFHQKPLRVIAAIDVDVPPVMADCNGYKLSVEELIRVVIEQQKTRWQHDIQQQITDGLMVLGL
ncbi:hypothetical protein [Marinagarivorans algicola]|uniref:hypothetical protein n=1 Tax=Marinagarivorans algicola TaxID=1513270 RepID=UPI0006B892F5|nr:hypothetical protein [Marinagarivorans algicola]